MAKAPTRTKKIEDGFRIFSMAMAYLRTSPGIPDDLIAEKLKELGEEFTYENYIRAFRGPGFRHFTPLVFAAFLAENAISIARESMHDESAKTGSETPNSYAAQLDEDALIYFASIKAYCLILNSKSPELNLDPEKAIDALLKFIQEDEARLATVNKPSRPGQKAPVKKPKDRKLH